MKNENKSNLDSFYLKNFNKCNEQKTTQIILHKFNSCFCKNLLISALDTETLIKKEFPETLLK